MSSTSPAVLPPVKTQRVQRLFVLMLSALAGLFATGCGTPGAPQPPSLHLPNPVSDLSAIRSGDTVALRWTNPRKTTDRLLIAGPIQARICLQNGSALCETIRVVSVQPGSKSELSETLGEKWRHGDPRPAAFQVELLNKHDRSAGQSNPAFFVAGTAPGLVSSFHGEAQKDGAALHWTPGENTAVRLHRKLVSTSAKTNPAAKGMMKAQPEPVLRDFVVDPGTRQDGAIDTTARFGESYEYTAQRLAQVEILGRSIELAGNLSSPVRIDMTDNFPPAVPTGLQAVAVPDEKTIDLSWHPDDEQDLAGYVVYRADVGAPSSWARISGDTPLPSPAYRDSSTQPGHTYRYTVTAIDLSGHESARSEETQESMPTP